MTACLVEDDTTTDASARAWDLLEAARGGDTEAFGELWIIYRPTVLRFIRYRMSSPHLRQVREDLTDETFARALRRIHTVTYRGQDPGAWFVTIARNIRRDFVKSSRYRLEYLYDAHNDQAGATDNEPYHAAVATDTADRLAVFVDMLGADQREVIQHRFYEGMSVTETAAVMDRGEGAVKALQHRAVRRLAMLVPPSLHIVT